MEFAFFGEACAEQQPPEWQHWSSDKPAGLGGVSGAASNWTLINMYDMKTRCPQIQIGARMFCKIIAKAAAAGVSFCFRREKGTVVGCKCSRFSRKRGGRRCFYPWAAQYSEEPISTCVWLYLGSRGYWLLDQVTYGLHSKMHLMTGVT